jgi:hypothetical protein
MLAYRDYEGEGSDSVLLDILKFTFTLQNFKASLVGPGWLNCKASAPYSAGATSNLS